MLVKQLELAKLDEAREGALIQVVDPALPPEQKSFPKRGLFTLAGLVVGFTFGILMALLEGGLVRMQHNPVTKDKLDLLKRSIWSGRHPQRQPAKEAVRPLRHARPEATG